MEEPVESEWNLSKYQVEVAAQALEAVWSAIRRCSPPSSHRAMDVTAMLQCVQGCYNGAGHLLLMLKSDRSAKGQIAKIADLCRRVGECRDFADEHKVALVGVEEFLGRIQGAAPIKGRAATQGASHVALQRITGRSLGKNTEEIDTSEGSAKLRAVGLNQRLGAIRHKMAALSAVEKHMLDEALAEGEERMKASKTTEELSLAYQALVDNIIDALHTTEPVSEPGKALLRWLCSS